MPTRVIDVGDVAGSARFIVWAGGPAEYLALSHCWGTTPGFTARRSNIDALKTGFRPSSLPATLRDAIILTRAWGFRYLWIDSLCIVQDDPTDWERESQNMHIVYTGATIVVAASSASSDQAGFLHDRWPSEASIASSRTNLCGVVATLPVRSYMDGFPQSILFSRAWTLQERLLACRVVHVHESRLFLECKTAMTLEEGTNLAIPLNDAQRIKSWRTEMCRSGGF